MERYLSGDLEKYDVIASFQRIQENNVVDTSSWKEFDEEKLQILWDQITEEFPVEVAETIVSLTRNQSDKLKTPEQDLKYVVSFYLKMIVDN